MYDYNEVYQASLEYFNGDELAVGSWADESSKGGVYVFKRVSASNWESVGGRILPPSATTGTWFGWSVSLEGDRLVVGAPEEGITGEAYVFDRDPISGNWESK